MTYLALLRSPLVWAAVAALLGWLAWGQFQRANAEAAARAAAQNAARVSALVAARESQAAADWRSLYAELSDVPTTRSCGPVVNRALEIARSRREEN